MSKTLSFVVRWFSYPLIGGGLAAAMLGALYRGLPYWPTTALLALAGVIAVALLERVQPFRREWLNDHSDTGTDLQHNLVNLTVIQFTAMVLAETGALLPDSMRIFPSDAAPLLQLVLVALVIDLSLYSMHRASHHIAWLWRLHTPHHSSERLYWLNGERRHPVHAVLMAGPGLLVLLLLGTPAAPIATWFGILTLHLAFQHANLDYRVGYLRYVIGVAETHRWHHKREFEDAQVNFGEFFLLWDHLFGTFFDSADKLGEAEVGVKERDYPTDYAGQLRAPFQR